MKASSLMNEMPRVLSSRRITLGSPPVAATASSNLVKAVSPWMLRIAYPPGLTTRRSSVSHSSW